MKSSANLESAEHENFLEEFNREIAYLFPMDYSALPLHCNHDERPLFLLDDALSKCIKVIFEAFNSNASLEFIGSISEPITR